MALALSYAMIGVKPHEKHNRFNLRKDEFAFRSDVKMVTGRTRTLCIWSLVVLGLLCFNYGVRRYFVSSRIDHLKQDEQTLCKQVTGQTQCLSIIKKTLAKNKQEKIPDMSALDIYLEVSNALPTTVQVKVTDLSIGNDGVRILGDTADFESVDQLVAALSKARCFKNVDKGRARQTQTGVNFQISMDVDCGEQS